MPTGKIVHVKQSGEVLSDEQGVRWTPTALKKAGKRIAEVRQNAEKLGVAGLMIVSGGGNEPDGFGRGDVMRRRFGKDNGFARYADVIGRRSAVNNAIMLSAALLELKVPHLLISAPNSAFEDAELGHVSEYDIKKVNEAYGKGKVVLIAGGTGKPNQTSDAGVVELASWQAEAYPDTPSVALKITTENGVFTDDPKKVSGTKRYSRLSASYMLQNFDRLSAVDRRSLELLEQTGKSGIDMSLRVYSIKYSIAEVLENPTLGTAIVSIDCEPMLA